MKHACLQPSALLQDMKILTPLTTTTTTIAPSLDLTNSYLNRGGESKPKPRNGLGQRQPAVPLASAAPRAAAASLCLRGAGPGSHAAPLHRALTGPSRRGMTARAAPVLSPPSSGPASLVRRIHTAPGRGSRLRRGA